MKTLVAYCSQYGSTRTYAQWIAEALGANLADTFQKEISLSGYGRIIFGGALYAGRINGIGLITKNPSVLEDSRLLIFVVGMGPYNGPYFHKTLTANGIPESLFPRCFYLRGGMDTSGLSFRHRFMINTLRFVLSLKPNKSPEIKQFLESFRRPLSYVSKDAIAPLVEAAKNA